MEVCESIGNPALQLPEPGAERHPRRPDGAGGHRLVANRGRTGSCTRSLHQLLCGLPPPFSPLRPPPHSLSSPLHRAEGGPFGSMADAGARKALPIVPGGHPSKNLRSFPDYEPSGTRGRFRTFRMEEDLLVAPAPAHQLLLLQSCSCSCSCAWMVQERLWPANSTGRSSSRYSPHPPPPPQYTALRYGYPRRLSLLSAKYQRLPACTLVSPDP